MVLAAIIMGVNFTSCKPDNTEEPTEDPVEIPAKKLVKFTTGVSEMFFSYDDQDRLIECEKVTQSYTFTYTYVWGENTIDIHENVDGDYYLKCTLNLVNGLAHQITEDPQLNDSIFKYDSSNRLIECGGRLDTKLLEWNDDMLTSIQLNGDNTTGHITYSYDKNSTTKGYNPLLPYEVTDDLYIAHPELAGIATQKLYDTKTSSAIMYEYEFSASFKNEYEFDEDGYVKKVIVTRVNEGGEETIDEYICVWE